MAALNLIVCCICIPVQAVGSSESSSLYHYHHHQSLRYYQNKEQRHAVRSLHPNIHHWQHDTVTFINPIKRAKRTKRIEGRVTTLENNHIASLSRRISDNNKDSLGYATIKRTTTSSTKSSLYAGFFDDLMNGKLFNKYNDDDDDDNSKNDGDDMNWNEGDFQRELEKRNTENNDTMMVENDQERKFKVSSSFSSSSSSMDRKEITQNEKESGTVLTSNSNNNDEDRNKEDEYDGYAFRDAIYQKWGKCYDVDFNPVQSFGFKELYLNVLPFHLGSKRFRHETELDYLCHLQAVVEILEKYDQLDYVLAQLEETTKKPRAGTSPLVAVPFRLNLTEDELDSILA